MRPAVIVLSLSLVAMALAAGCGVDTTDDDGSASSVTGQGGGGASATGAAGGGGSAVFPCGFDCSTIETTPCQQAVCDEASKGCVVMDRADGIGCDDGLFCTETAACQAGACTAQTQNQCGLTSDPCSDVVCDEASETCAQQVLADGAACVSDDLCQQASSCTNGLCSGVPNDCFFAPVPNDCHVAVCNPANGECEPQAGNEGQSCTDVGDLCTIGKSCTGGSCLGGVPKNCSALTQGCQLGVCDVVSGQCQSQQLTNGDPCDDLDPCTSGELCNAGSCTGGGLILACMPNDNCCPSGCTDINDADCALDILLMGDNVSNTHWDTYRNALTAAGASWTERNLDTSTFPTPAELQPFNTIIWFEETTVTSGDAQCQQVVDWLNLGNRRLFMTGVYMLWDFANGAAGNGENNLYQTMGVSYAGHGSGVGITDVNGLFGDAIAGSFVAPNGLTLAANIDSSGDYANQLVGPATHGALYGSGGVGSGKSAVAHYNAGSYRVVWLGLNFHNGMTNANQRNAFMTNVLNYFQ